MKILLIVNPISGSRGIAMKEAEALRKILEESGNSVEMFKTQKRGDALQRTQESDANEFSAVCVVGGDGTLNEVINGVAEKRIPIVPVPVGLSNVLAKEVGASCEPTKIAESLKAKNIIKIDLFEVEFLDKDTKKKRFFAAMAGVGFDADVVSRITSSRKRNLGFAGYVPSIAKSMLSRSRMFSIIADGRIVSNKATYLVVGNVPYYGGPFYITTEASPTSGYMDVVYGEGLSSFSIIKFYAGVLLGTHLRHRRVRYIRCKRLELMPQKEEETPPLHIDGEAVGTIPVSVRVIPKGLSLIVPKRT